MAFNKDTPYTWSDSNTMDNTSRNIISPYTPLKKMNSTDNYNNKNDVPNIANQIRNMMVVDQDESFDEEDFSYLPPPVNTTPNLSWHSSNSSDSNHIQYINTVRKTRPLPKIPERNGAKDVSKNNVLSDDSKNEKKLTAQQLFEMLSHTRISAMKNTENEDSNDEEDKDDEENKKYGGVYALKTQIPSPVISNSTLDNNTSYQYENFNTNYYKMMTPVEEVEEDQLYNTEYEQDLSPSYVLQPVNHISDHSSSEASMNESSIKSGRTSPSSNNSRYSVEYTHQNNQYYQENKVNVQQEQETIIIDEFEIQSSYHQHDLTSSDITNYESRPSHESQSSMNQVQEEISLVSDVRKLAELNKALMTPIIPNKNIETTQAALLYQKQENTDPIFTSDYTNINTSSPLAITSFSLTHDKDSIKTYRRMATKANDKNIQFTYAKYLLQLVSFYGNDREKNATRDRLQEEAEYWIEKLAKSNHSEALYIKGQWHSHCCDQNAIGVFVGSQYKKVNQTKAFKCFQQAAKFGSTESYYELAEYWKHQKDYKKALSNYRYAASKNHILSLYKLANIMLRGLLNQEKDVRQGLIFLKKAADSNMPESARSAYDLACLYSNDLESIGLDRNTLIAPSVSSQTYGLAVYYYKKADRFGLSLATFRLGYIYEHGHLNIEANVPDAFTYYLKAAEKKHEGAMLEISKLYKEGIPGYLTANPIIAHEWCTRAAESGNEIAEFMLGIYFEYGIGTYPDQKQAFVWYSKSASKGYGPAENKLNVPQSKRKSAIINQEIENKISNRGSNKSKKYYQESIRIAEKSRRTHAEQENCQIM